MIPYILTLGFNMRFERCLVDIVIRDGSSNQLEIPKNVFNNIVSGKYIAVKKKNEDILKLFKIPEEGNAYELYAEIMDKQLSLFIIKLTEIARDFNEVEIIPDLSDGGCPGYEKDGKTLPCTWNGFLTIRGNKDREVLEAVTNKLESVKNQEGMPIVEKMQIGSVEENATLL